MTFNPHEYRKEYLDRKRNEIAHSAANYFDKGYTLNTISKTLYNTYHAVTGFSRDEIRSIVGNAVLAFVIIENSETSKSLESVSKQYGTGD